RDYCPTTDTPADWVAESIFFNQWTTRQSPWAEFEDGTRLWWVDQATREIRWEIRAAHVIKQPFRSRREAGDLIRRCFGLIPTDLSDYYAQAADSGWLLAFGIEVMQPVDGVVLPRGEVLGRNGFRRISGELAQALATAGLPEPASEPIAAPPAWFNSHAITSVFVPNRSRQIPESVRRAVHERDGGRCVRCGDGPPTVELHVDHVYPWSKGGTNELSNLQLLCQRCNLSKGAKVEDGTSLEIFEEPVTTLARALERPPIRSAEDLPGLIASGVAAGHSQLAADAVVTVDFEGNVHEAIVMRCIDELERDPGLADRVTVLRSDLEGEEEADRLRPLLESSDESVAQEVALFVAVYSDDDEQVELLTRASRSETPLVSGSARLALALGSDASDDELEEMLRAELVAPDARVRAAAALELIDFIDDEGEDEMLALLNVALASHDDEHFAIAALVLADYWAGADDDRTRSYIANVIALNDPDLSDLGRQALDEFERTGRVLLESDDDVASEAELDQI
ncbi:MAG: HNH endonuclease, partial [Microthrixaceae bacterium]